MTDRNSMEQAEMSPVPKKGWFMRIIEKISRRFGYRLMRVQGWNSVTVPVRPKSLIDVGSAFATPDLYSHFPDGPILLIDPLREYEPNMREIVAKRGGAYEICALGETAGEIEINVNLDRPVRSSVFERTTLTMTSHRYEKRQVKVETLDTVMSRQNLPEPIGLKIDTEGAELDVLKGSVETLSRCSFVIAEVSVQARFEGGYRFEQLVEFMANQGFTVANVLSAEPDESGLVRYVDLLFIPLSGATRAG